MPGAPSVAGGRRNASHPCAFEALEAPATWRGGTAAGGSVSSLDTSALRKRYVTEAPQTEAESDSVIAKMAEMIAIATVLITRPITRTEPGEAPG